MMSQSREWPRKSSELGTRLTRLTPDLEKVGVKVERKKTAAERLITLEWSGA